MEAKPPLVETEATTAPVILCWIVVSMHMIISLYTINYMLDLVIGLPLGTNQNSRKTTSTSLSAARYIFKMLVMYVHLVWLFV